MWENHSLAGGQREAVDAVIALNELREFVQDFPLVCHNAAFDKCVIENEINKVSHFWKPANKWICTLHMARSSQLGVFVGYSPGRNDGMSYKLEHVANALNLPLSTSQLHIGHYDAEVAGKLLLEFVSFQISPNQARFLVELGFMTACGNLRFNNIYRRAHSKEWRSCRC